MCERERERERERGLERDQGAVQTKWLVNNPWCGVNGPALLKRETKGKDWGSACCPCCCAGTTLGSVLAVWAV